MILLNLTNMNPLSILDFYQQKGMYTNFDQIKQNLKNIKSLVFFEVSEISFLSFNLLAINCLGQAPIYYNNTDIL